MDIKASVLMLLRWEQHSFAWTFFTSSPYSNCGLWEDAVIVKNGIIHDHEISCLKFEHHEQREQKKETI